MGGIPTSHQQTAQLQNGLRNSTYRQQISYRKSPRRKYYMRGKQKPNNSKNTRKIAYAQKPIPNQVDKARKRPHAQIHEYIDEIHTKQAKNTTSTRA